MKSLVVYQKSQIVESYNSARQVTSPPPLEVEKQICRWPGKLPEIEVLGNTPPSSGLVRLPAALGLAGAFGLVGGLVFGVRSALPA